MCQWFLYQGEYFMTKNVANIAFEIPSPTFQVSASVSEILDVMDVIGFQDQGREKVAEVIHDKFQDLVTGHTGCIPPELFEYADTIMEVVTYLSKIST
ncbi:MAG: hypothetical protein AXW17_09770 [Colwellia sp. Phe_37]|jgi:hypothetical protein|nr:MAG: hypothetical protein AXW17_09770 [Colwellia sp. Phe_37]